MTAAVKIHSISVEEYLATELDSPIKREYSDGVVSAKARAHNAHNLIATNLLVALVVRLRGGPCRPYNSDTKIRIQLASQTRFYHPDASIICRPNRPEDSFQDDPAAVVEVLSHSTRRIDEGAKKDACLAIPSLAAYLLVEQDRSLVTVYRRTDEGFVHGVYSGLETVIPLPEVGIELPLAEVYDGVQFALETDSM